MTNSSYSSICWQVLLDYNNYNPTLALNTLHQFIESFNEIENLIEQYYPLDSSTPIQGDFYEELLLIVHKLRGASYLNGTLTLSEICQNIEKDLYRGITPSLLNTKLIELRVELSKIKEESKQIEEKIMQNKEQTLTL